MFFVYSLGNMLDPFCMDHRSHIFVGTAFLGALLLMGAGCKGAATSSTTAETPSAKPVETTKTAATVSTEAEVSVKEMEVEKMFTQETEAANAAEADVSLEDIGIVQTETTEANDVTIAVHGGSFYFTPSEIRVKKGDNVKVVFTNDGGVHSFLLDAFGVKMDPIKLGETKIVVFVADKAGTFEYYCGVGEHRQMGQKGTLIVE